MKRYMTIDPAVDKDETIEVLQISGRDMCMVANGVLICRCGKCKPEEYKLPEDYKNLFK